MKKYLLIIPLLILCGQIYWITISEDEAALPQETKNVIPEFILPSLFDAKRVISHSDLKGEDIRIINFFASWCGPCKVEHPLLMDLARRGISIMGVNYQDSPESAKEFLKDKGNPFKLTAWDKSGMTGMSWGIMSIPQTFVINAKGEILYHRSGRLHPENIPNDILPIVNKK